MYENTDGNILTMFFKNTHITKASKASLAGTRLSRIYSIFKVLRVFSLGRIYKHNLDALVKKNEEIIIKHKNKHKTSQRRKSVQIHSLEDKIKFFKQIHQVLNIPSNIHVEENNGQDVTSNINPFIIKNFYEYALTNEIKRENQKKGSIVNQHAEFLDEESKLERIEEKPFEDPLVFEALGTNTIINDILKDGNFADILRAASRKETNVCRCQSMANTIVSNNTVKNEEVCRGCGMLKLKNKLMDSVNTFVDNDSIEEEKLEEDIKIENEKVENALAEDNGSENPSKSNNHSGSIKVKGRRNSAFKFLNKFNIKISPVRPRFKKSGTYDQKTLPKLVDIPEPRDLQLAPDVKLQVTPAEKPENYTMKFFKDFENPNGEHGTKLSISISKIFTMRVVLIVLLVLFLDPFVSLDNYMTLADQYSFQVDVLANYLATNNIDFLLSKIDTMINDEKFADDNDFELIELGFSDSYIREVYNLTSLFPTDMIFRNETVYNHTRAVDRIYIDNDYLYLIYNNVYYNDLNAIFNMMKILFIAACLWLFSFIFVFDVNNVVIVPLEELFGVMKTNKIQNESLYYDVDKAIEDDMKQYTHLYEDILSIERFFRLMSYTIVKVIGIRFYDFFRQSLVEDSEENKRAGMIYNLKGYIMAIRISNFSNIISRLGENSVPLLSKIIGIIDLAVFENYGEILRINSDVIIVFFDRSYLENLNNTGVANFKQKSQNVKSYLANSALLSAIHIISRVRTLIPDPVELNISLHKGKINTFLVNTDNMIDFCVYSKNLKKTLLNLVIIYNPRTLR
jgi:hypothetical protein